MNRRYRRRIAQLAGAAAAFTLIELLSVLAVVAILMTIIIPTVSKVRDTAGATRCTANIRQLGLGLLSYASSNEGRLPNLQNPFWDRAALGMVTGYSPVLKCPADEAIRPAAFAATPRSYSLNPVLVNFNGNYASLGAASLKDEGISLTDVMRPEQTAMLIECHRELNIYNNGNWVVASDFKPVHGTGMNVAMCDGSVARIGSEQQSRFRTDYLSNQR